MEEELIKQLEMYKDFYSRASKKEKAYSILTISRGIIEYSIAAGSFIQGFNLLTDFKIDTLTIWFIHIIVCSAFLQLGTDCFLNVYFNKENIEDAKVQIGEYTRKIEEIRKNKN